MGSLSTIQMVGILVLFFAGYSIYNTWALRDKIYCTFIRKDGTQIHKYAKVKAERIIFDNSYYNLHPERTTLKLVFMGFIPTWVRCLIFKWDSNMPLNPKTWNNDYDNPNDRAALDKTEDLRALQETQKTALAKGGGKKGMLESLMPIILIVGVLILGYMAYTSQQKIDMLGSQYNTVQSQMMDLMKALGH